MAVETPREFGLSSQRPTSTMRRTTSLHEKIELTFWRRSSQLVAISLRFLCISLFALSSACSTPGAVVPCLEIDGLTLAQSWAIIRYIARYHNLEPANVAHQAKADMIAECVRDFESAANLGGYGWSDKVQSRSYLVLHLVISRSCLAGRTQSEDQRCGLQVVSSF
jgi:hypothetical protein